ncbi:MAG: sugar phosphate isomerase/epimerase [Anaerolineales bacterium]|nr:sugar phosphate isomerase/epimerase [Anaerolineales bacterium]
MKVGCFALIDPFSVLDHQLGRIQEWGFKYADVTDNTDGGCLGVEFGFTAVASLDANPFDLKRMFEQHGLTITSYCAHANLLDPAAPWRYGTAQIIKAVRAAAAMGVKHVITTEGDPKTEFGHNLSEREALFSIREKLYEPLRMAADYGVKILLEPHGKYTDSVDHMEKLLELCNSDALGVNMDTGNCWLGGGDPVEMIKRLGSKIEHVHWKDWPAEMEAQRGKVFGAGMSIIPLGTGVVDIKGSFEALKAAGYNGYTTLEVAGEENVKQSYAYLKSLGAE